MKKHISNKSALSMLLLVIAVLTGCTYEGPSGGTLYYPDNDRDGHGDVNSQGTPAFMPPAGMVTSHDDCNDANPAVFPGASEVCNSIDDNCNGQVNEGLQCDGPICTPSAETCDGRDNDCDGLIDEGACNSGEQCINGSAPATCSPGSTSTTLAQCDGFCTRSCNGGNRHLYCATNGTWQCVCDSGPSPGCGASCPSGTHCEGMSCVPNGGGCSSNPEICGNATDDNCDGRVDEYCMMMSSAVNVRVRCTLPASAPNANSILLWNPYTHTESAPAAGCLSNASGLRSHECSWMQSGNDPVVFQAKYMLSSAIRYVDQQSGRVAPATQTTIWACTQEQASPLTPFDSYGSCQVWVDGVSRGFTAVDNASRALYPDGPRCGNGCNFTVSGFTPPSNICTM